MNMFRKLILTTAAAITPVCADVLDNLSIGGKDVFSTNSSGFTDILQDEKITIDGTSAFSSTNFWQGYETPDNGYAIYKWLLTSTSNPANKYIISIQKAEDGNKATAIFVNKDATVDYVANAGIDASVVKSLATDTATFSNLTMDSATRACLQGGNSAFSQAAIDKFGSADNIRQAIGRLITPTNLQAFKVKQTSIQVWEMGGGYVGLTVSGDTSTVSHQGAMYVMSGVKNATTGHLDAFYVYPVDEVNSLWYYDHSVLSSQLTQNLYDAAATAHLGYLGFIAVPVVVGSGLAVKYFVNTKTRKSLINQQVAQLENLMVSGNVRVDIIENKRCHDVTVTLVGKPLAEKVCNVHVDVKDSSLTIAGKTVMSKKGYEIEIQVPDITAFKSISASAGARVMVDVGAHSSLRDTMQVSTQGGAKVTLLP